MEKQIEPCSCVQEVYNPGLVKMRDIRAIFKLNK